VCCSVLQCVAVPNAHVVIPTDGRKIWFCQHLHTHTHTHTNTLVYTHTLSHTRTRTRTHTHTHIHMSETWAVRLVSRVASASVCVTATLTNTLHHTTTHCSTLQHASTLCNTLQHTAWTHLRTEACLYTGVHFRLCPQGQRGWFPSLSVPDVSSVRVEVDCKRYNIRAYCILLHV